MPYKVKGNCVYKKDTGAKVGCTKGSVDKYLAALYANANESVEKNNSIKGGKADKFSIKDIAKKFNVSVEKIESQIKKGIEIEKEHTSDKEKATEIAMDHVTEFPDYYDRIEKMEKEAKKKWESGEEKTNEGIKKSIAAAALGLGLMGTPNISKGTSLIPTTQTQTQKVLSKVNFEASQPISNPDLDLVHGVLGSNRLQDDFEKRVEDELTNQIKNGNTPDVSNIQVKTYIQGDKIITKASCDIIQSQDGIAYNHFTTRGSIGSRYAERHDNQITGLVDRLENYYGGGAKQVGNPIDISFNLNGNVITYRQSFFVASDNKNTSNITNQTTEKISGSDINDLRNKLNSETKDVYIDINSINVDMNNYKITYKTGDVKIYKISLLFDDSGNLDNRLRNIKSQNPTFKEVKRGSIGNLDWVISVIPYEESKNETKTLIKNLLKEGLSRKEVIDFVLEFNFFLSLNLAKVQQEAKDSNSLNELNVMMQNIRKPLINGKNIFELAKEINSIVNNPKMLSALLNQIKNLLEYIEPRLKKYLKDSDKKNVWLKKIENFKTIYLNIIKQ